MSQWGGFPGILPAGVNDHDLIAKTAQTTKIVLAKTFFDIEFDKIFYCNAFPIGYTIPLPSEWFFYKFVDLFVIGVGREASLQKLSTEKHQFIHQ